MFSLLRSYLQSMKININASLQLLLVHYVHVIQQFKIRLLYDLTQAEFICGEPRDRYCWYIEITLIKTSWRIILFGTVSAEWIFQKYSKSTNSGDLLAYELIILGMYVNQIQVNWVLYRVNLMLGLLIVMFTLYDNVLWVLNVT